MNIIKALKKRLAAAGVWMLLAPALWGLAWGADFSTGLGLGAAQNGAARGELAVGLGITGAGLSFYSDERAMKNSRWVEIRFRQGTDTPYITNWRRYWEDGDIYITHNLLWTQQWKAIYSPCLGFEAGTFQGWAVYVGPMEVIFWIEIGIRFSPMQPGGGVGFRFYTRGVK